ncbi:MAG: GspE/PulE family protein, partial [Acidobacteriota bacterium]
MSKNTAFLDLIVSKGIVTTEAALKLGDRYGEDGLAVLMHLVRRKAAPKSVLGRLWGDSLGIAFIDLKTTLFNRQIVREIPEELARRNQAILMYRFGKAVTAAMADPRNQIAVRQLEEHIHGPVSPVFAFADDIADAIEIQYRADDELKALSGQIITDTVLIEDISELTMDQLQNVAGSKSVVEFVQGLILMAVRDKASDIHIEPYEEYVRIRFRMDGMLQEKIRLERLFLAPVLSRLKVLANLDITERRRPQDGRITINLRGRSVDLRISCTPAIHGEKVVMRLLGLMDSDELLGIDELHLSLSNKNKLKAIMDSPQGIFFITGPTGSGKTTSLFAMIKEMNQPETNIMTIEDPVEYRLEGINQVSVNLAVDVTFASALRSFLRQDPDVILVGEIRDFDTASIACQAALTGHLVLATLHTN